MLFKSAGTNPGRGEKVAKFSTTREQSWFVHIFPTKQFQTRQMSIRLVKPLARDGLTATAVLPYLLMEGTRNHPSAKNIMRYADDLFGVVVRTGVSKRGTVQVVEASASMPEESAIRGANGLFQQVQRLLFEILAEPKLDNNRFPDAHVDRELTLHQKRIESLYDDKIAYAMERCVEEMGRGEMFGLPRLGYLDDLPGLSSEALRRTHEQLLQQAEVHVYIVGNFESPEATAEVILSALQSNFGSQESLRHQIGKLEAVSYRGGAVRTVEENQDVNQGKLNLGFRTNTAYSHLKYPALLVANGILGGFPHSKLFVNVREKASLAYYASSRLESLTGVVTVQTGIDSKNYEKALEIILQQVETLKQGVVSQEELEFTKSGLRNQYLQAQDQAMSMMDVHFSGVLAGSERTINDLLEQLSSVNIDDVVEMAQALRQDTVYFLGNKGGEA